MNKYLLTFEKKGYIKYISHLDMLRLFQRVFRRSGIKLAYSQGFNPHPKMSFALPLSLGYTGLAEFLEIETSISYENEDIMNKVNEIMPDGIRVTDVAEFLEKKSLGSMVNAAEFIIEIPLEVGENIDYIQKASEFMMQESIITKKLQRKTGKILDIDIRHLIHSMNVTVVDDKLIMETCIAQGSQATLSPELLLTTFFDFVPVKKDMNDIEFTRKRILY